MKKKTLYFISFIEGAAVMGVELIGGKMLAPYFGTSLYAWSAVIAVSLLGLTTGYYTGGIISHKKPNHNTLFYLLISAAVFTGIMPLTSPSIIEAMLSMDFRTGAVLSALLFLFPPLLFYGAVSPMIIRLLSQKNESTGKKTGNVFAISTAGGILATFGVGFYILPEAGIRLSVAYITILIAIFPIIYFFTAKKVLTAFGCIIVIFLSFFFNYKIHIKPPPESDYFTVLFRSNSLLGNIMVVDDQTKHRGLFINNISQSFMHLPTGRSQWTYVHRLATYTSFKPSGSKVFLAGLGAGNVVNELEILGFDIDVCDIDPRMETMAKEYFGMTENANVIIDDARHAIKTADEKYDIVILDISAGENQPTNLYTVEGFKDIQSILKEDGALFIHYPSILKGNASLALRSIGKTLKAAGFHVELVNTKPKPNDLSEFIFYASMDGSSLKEKNFDRRDAFARPFNFPVEKNVLLKGVDFSKGLVLTDNKPQMDKLHQPLARKYRMDGIKQTIGPLINEGVRMF